MNRSSELGSVVDIGSNAIRWSTARLTSGNQLVVVDSGRESVRLGEDVFRTGRVSEITLKRLINALRQFVSAHEKSGAQEVRVIATSALREARNREEILSQVRKQTGLEIEIISGMEEARIIRKAVESKVDLSCDAAILLDVGGGSLELTFCRNGDVVFADSLKAGTVRLLQVLEEAKGNYKLLERFIRQYSYGVIKELKRDFDGTPISLFVGTGGNIESLGVLKAQLIDGGNSSFISVQELETLVQKLSEKSVQERIRDFGMKPDRADVIVPAAYVVLSVMRWFSIDQIAIPRVGLREGALQELLEHRGIQVFSVGTKELESYALELGRRFHFSEVHARAVAQHCRALFASLQKNHGLGEEAEILLVVASILHDIGQAINYSGHHKHSYYIIKSVPFFGLTARQKQVVAAVARYHRKASPSLKHEAFQLVPMTDRDMVQKLAAILRIADAIDREHEGKKIEVEVDASGKTITLTLHSSEDLEIEQWAIHKKKKLFEQVFHRELVVERKEPR